MHASATFLQEKTHSDPLCAIDVTVAAHVERNHDQPTSESTSSSVCAESREKRWTKSECTDPTFLLDHRITVAEAGAKTELESPSENQIV